jgi:DNA (cytosine-5)-methyltransferase 1
MENVRDVINYSGHNIAQETCEVLASMGYVCGDACGYVLSFASV